MLSPAMYSRAKAALLSVLVLAAAAVITAVVGFVMASPTFGWTGEHLSCCLCASDMGDASSGIRVHAARANSTPLAGHVDHGRKRLQAF